MSKRKGRTPSLPPAVLLRPRLDALLTGQNVGPEVLLSQIGALLPGVSSGVFLATLLRSVAAAPAVIQDMLAPRLTAWLRGLGRYDELHAIAFEQSEEPALVRTAQSWLVAGGEDISALAPVRLGLEFCGALRYGSDVQKSVSGFWYADHHRNRVLQLAFLTDTDEPWEGAVKDVFLKSGRSQAAMRQEIEDIAAEVMLGQAGVEDLTDAAFKQTLLSALLINRRQNIGLPFELRELRDFFATNVLSLPDTPGAEGFTLADFDAMSNSGRNVEALRHHERRYGKVVRLDDGEEVRIMPFDPDDI